MLVRLLFASRAAEPAAATIAAAADVEHPPGSSDVGGAGHHPRGDLAVVLVHLRYDRPAFVTLRVHVLVLLSHGITDTA